MSPELSYWWRGLKDDDDDGIWEWSYSKQNTEPMNQSCNKDSIKIYGEGSVKNLRYFYRIDVV